MDNKVVASSVVVGEEDSLDYIHFEEPMLVADTQLQLGEDHKLDPAGDFLLGNHKEIRIVEAVEDHKTAVLARGLSSSGIQKDSLA